MDARELEEFDLGIDLAKNKQEQAANFVFNRLLQNHPENIYLLTLCAFTASTPAASFGALETALKLDPANSMLLEAKAWLEDYYRIVPEVVAPVSNSSSGKAVERTVVIPHVTATTIKPSPKAATRPQSVIAKLKQPVKIPAAAKTARPAINKKIPDKPRAVSFSGLSWLFLGCSLVFFGAATILFYMVVVADNLDEPEKVYLDQIVQLNQLTNEVNSQLQTAINQYNAGRLEKSELEKYFRHVIGLDEKFRLLKSPSPRFARLNELLSQAYNSFNRGAVDLIMGLNANDTRRMNDGNHLLTAGNEFLRQARDELTRFGG